jgi:hypothetical protein
MPHTALNRSLPRLIWAAASAFLVLFLPLAAHAFRVNEATQEWLYPVQRGDNLYTLAERYLQSQGDWSKLQRLNRVVNPYQLPVGSTLRIPLPWLRKELTNAQVNHVRGNVQIVRGSQPGVPLVVGEKVHMGDALNTGPESSVTVQMLDGSQLLVLPNSQLSFETLLLVGKGKTPHTQVMLLQGGVETQVQPRDEPLRRYEIKTPTATLGARGTAYRVRSLRNSEGGSSSAVEVTEGRVAATAKEETQVPAGYGLVLSPTTLATAPTRLLDAPVLQNETLRLDRLPLRIEWPDVSGAVGYRAQVFSEIASSKTELLLDTLFANNTARWSDLPDGRYQLRVRAVDASGLEGRDANQVLIVKARPEPPVLRSPRPQSKVYGNQTTLEWAQVSGVVGYRLQVFNDGASVSKDTTPWLEQVLTDTTQHTLPFPPGHYRWRVASIRAGGDQGPYGDATPFEQRSVPASPTAEPPKLDGKNLTLSWRALLPGQQVELQLARDANFETLVVNEKTSATELTLPTPAPGSYHLRMRTLDADGFAGPFGAPQQIEVPRSWRWLLIPASLLLLAL